MTSQKARLIVSLCLFLAWLAFLGFLVSERYTIILSQPQFAIADAIIIAEVKAEDSTVQIKEIPWCERGVDRKSIPNRFPELVSLTKANGFLGPGDYIIPLSTDGFFEITPVRTGGMRNYTHASLYIFDGGPNVDSVIKRLLRYAQEKPQHAEGLVAPALVRYLGFRILMPDVDVAVGFHELMLPRRLPLPDARILQKDLKALGAEVQLVHFAELRVYPDLPQTRSQLEKLLAVKKK